jgi:hypothetical protein
MQEGKKEGGKTKTEGREKGCLIIWTSAKLFKAAILSTHNEDSGKED